MWPHKYIYVSRLTILIPEEFVHIFQMSFKDNVNDHVHLRNLLIFNMCKDLPLIGLFS